MTTWKPQAGAHKSKYFQKILILASGYHQNHLKVFGCLDSCFCVFMWVIWNFHQKITVARILGHGEEPPELLRPVLEAGKMVKLRQIMQNPEIVATKGLGFLFFSIYFRFFAEAHVDFVYAITGAIATVIFATLARFVACFGNIPWWWKTNLVRFRLNRWWSCDLWYFGWWWKWW